MLDPNKFEEKAKSIYEAHMDEWEKLYDGKIIAIDLMLVISYLLVIILEMLAWKQGESDLVTIYLCVESVKIPRLPASGIETMRKKVTCDYYDNDPLVMAILLNPFLNKKEKAYTYLDTGSDAVVIPKDIWLRLGLETDLIANVNVVGSTAATWYTFIDLEFLKSKRKDVEVFCNDAAGDVLIGRNILDEYSVTFDVRNSKFHIE